MSKIVLMGDSITEYMPYIYKEKIGAEEDEVKYFGVENIGVGSFTNYVWPHVDKDGVDTDYQIVASMTNSKENLENLIRGLNPKYKELIKNYDDLDHAIAAHWGPNAFGYIYVKAK